MKQGLLLPEFKLSHEHGGERHKNTGKRKRKIARPLSSKQPVHFTMRSEHARGNLSFLKKEKALYINNLRSELGKKYFVTTYQFANSGNHLHFLSQYKDKKAFQNFLRVFAGLVARFVTKAEKGKPFGKKFWSQTVWSRLVSWGKAFYAAMRYVLQNELESAGIYSLSATSSRS
jgi:REP element-mobilizing transposase RayT